MIKNKFFNIFKWICLVGYITLGTTLIVEACINGDSSTNQSNSVGGTLADVFNDLSGDQAKLVDPESVEIINKIDEAKVGDVYRIKTSLTPHNSSCSSFYYTSSDLNIASIKEDGTISFLNKGRVTITVTNQQFLNVYDSMIVDVNEVPATSIKSSIGSATYDKTSATYYLYTTKTYTLDTTFIPTNTTNKDVTYSLSTNEFLSIDENGYIIPKVNSYNKVTEITTHKDNLITTTKVVVIQEKVNDVVDFTVEDINIYVGEKVKVSPTFKPTNATYRDIEIHSPSSSLKVENNYITGLQEDVVTILVSSPKYSINKEVKVNILPNRELQTFDINLNKNIVVGSETLINVFNISPIYSDISKINYSLSDESIGVIENGYFKAKQIGSTIINAQYNNHISSFEINVTNKVDNITDFNLKSYDNNLEIQKLYDLNSLFEVESYIPNNPNSNELSFTLSDPSYGDIVNSALYTKKAGNVNLIITHSTSGIYKTIPLFIKYPFKVLDSSNNEINEIDQQYGEDFTFTIKDESNGIQQYQINHSENIVINETIKNNNKHYTISSITNESSYIEIIPIINNEEHNKTFINIDMEESTILSLGYKLSFIAMDRKMVQKNLSYFPISVRSSAYIKPMASREVNGTIEKIELDNISSKNITYEVEDESIAKVTVQNEESLAKIEPVSPGETYVIMRDTVSNYGLKIKILILNQVITQDSTYIFTGNTLEKDGTNYYQITNGNSASLIINFNYEKTTYFDVKYFSSNPEVASINSDGVITTHKEGETDIHFICHDGISPITIENIINYCGGVEGTIRLKVNKLELITDLDSFFLLVRKGIGHFGAFLVLGIFSTFTFALFFNKKKWKITFPINLIQGLVLAAITEIIQLLVPGRAGLLSDVLIDCSGFIISTLIISILMIVLNIDKKNKSKKEIILEIKELDE